MNAVREHEEKKKITLTWENVTVTAQPRGTTPFEAIWRNFATRAREETLTILKEASGYAESSNMVAIMGPSGAGKTTLLSTIAKKTQPTLGSVKVNGFDVSNNVMSNISSYMPQFNEMLVHLTPREHLLFVCALKMDKNVSYCQKLARTEKLLNEFGLYECKDILISNLSGGERKRLSLISELVTKPKILFLDEPTTDLDSLAAINIVRSLKLISLNDTLVFCTIHQPGMAVYNMFTHIILLADGRNAFCGSIEDIQPFFESQGYKCPAGIDESEYYVSILSQRGSTTSTRRSCQISEAFLRSSYFQLPVITDHEEIRTHSYNQPGWITQFSWLSWRIYKRKRRTIFSDGFSWISFLISMTVVSIFFSGSDSHTQNGVQNVRGALYMMTSEIVFTVAYSVIYELPVDTVNYRRETSMYGPAVYYFATFLGMIPKSITKAFIFTLFVFLILKRNIRWSDFFLYCLSTTLGAICGTAYGMMMSSWTKNIDITTMIMVPIDMLFLLSAGMFYNLRSLPTYLAYLKYSSIFYYINESLAILYWSRVDEIECEADKELPCLENGAEVLFEYGYNESHFTWDLCGMILLTMFMCLIGYIGVKRSRAESLSY
ncbi:hypothetical protein KPH14_002540 [Odynerus spinipes]|uniref:ABC transporter domain-containing protein n=1 Tax=Odynerus spinipes TaxID=1348599 RepID=A0AAD9RS45_9HYME|nr:hypothetical protein KPH14_002540 [Odynerus spinipes]